MSCVLCISFASRATTLTRAENVRSNNSGHRPQPIREWYQSLVLYNGTAASKACLHSGSDDLSPSPGHHSARYSVFCLFPPLWSPVRGKAFFTPFLSLPFPIRRSYTYAQIHPIMRHRLLRRSWKITRYTSLSTENNSLWVPRQKKSWEQTVETFGCERKLESHFLRKSRIPRHSSCHRENVLQAMVSNPFM